LVESKDYSPQSLLLFSIPDHHAALSVEAFKALLWTNLPSNIDRINRIQNFILPYLLPDHTQDLYLNMLQFCNHAKQQQIGVPELSMM